MKENRATLITILVLLGIFGSITLFGTLVKLKNRVSSSNPNHEFYFNNELYFYDENDELLGTYACSTDNCGYIKTIIDDNKYGIDYYKDGTMDELKVYNDEYAYIQDGDKVLQYSFASEKVTQEFSAFKNYNTEIEKGIVFFQKDNKWGVFSLTNDMVLNYGYSYIGLKNNVEEGILKADSYIAAKDNNWYILNEAFEAESVPLSKEIKTYSKDYIICSDRTIYDYNGNEVMSSDYFKDIQLVNNYIIGITNTNIAIVYLKPNEEAIGYANLGDYSNLKIEVSDNAMNFYDNTTLIQSVALS